MDPNPLPEHPFHSFQPAFLLGFGSAGGQAAGNGSFLDLTPSLEPNIIPEAWAVTCAQQASIPYTDKSPE